MPFYEELGRRNVFRVGIAYAIVAWLVVQVADIVLENIGAPAWVMQTLMLGLALGFIVSLIFSWAYEVTPEGVKRESEVDRSGSITHVTGRKLDRVIIGLLVVALAYFVWESRVADRPAADSAPTTVATNAPAEAEITQTEVSDLSVAVLPFENRSNLVEDEFFTEGMHDDLLTTLAKIGSMKVISRTSVMEYKDTTKKIPEIAAELGVANILEGGVQRAGNQVRINVQLIDAETDEHLWAEIYDRRLTAENLFAIQSEISKAIADALHATLSPEEAQRIDKVPTDNLEAFDYYLRGRQRMASRAVDDLRASTQAFLTAVELDPGFALAWVGVADSHGLLARYSDAPDGTYFEIRDRAVNQALEIDPELGEAYASLGLLLTEKIERAAAEVAFKTAIRYSPNYATAYHWLSNTMRYNVLRAPEAAGYAVKAAELDPNSAIILTNLAGAHSSMGDFETANRYLEQVRTMHPEFPQSYRGLSVQRSGDGDWVASVEARRKVVELDPDSVTDLVDLALQYAEFGALKEARQISQSAGERFPGHAMTQMLGAALDLLEDRTANVREVLAPIIERNPGFSSAILASNIAQAAGDAELALASAELLEKDDFSALPFSEEFLGTWVGALCGLSWSLLESEGLEARGRELLAKSIALYESGIVQGMRHTERFDFDLCYLMDEQPDKAIDILEKQLAGNFTYGWQWMLSTAPYELIRQDPRFVAIQTEYDRRMAEQVELLRKQEKARPAFEF